MLSFISSSYTHIPNSHHVFPSLNTPLVPSLISEYNPKKRDYGAAISSRYLGFTEARRPGNFQRYLGDSWRCWCNLSGGDAELEAEIMDFMAKSEKPAMFPTRKELIAAGRIDLAEAVKKRGGWFSLGWEEENVGDYNVEEAMDFDVGEFRRRVESSKESASLREKCDDSLSGGNEEDGFSEEVNSEYGNQDSLQSADSSSSSKSMEFGPDVDSGIEGILSRLEKHRNSNFGIDLGKNGYEAHAESKDEADAMHLGVAVRTDLGENGSRNDEPETWRTWSHKRAGLQKFEAAEISFGKNGVESDKEISHDGITVTTEKPAEMNYNQIRARLQHLHSELTTALCSIRSKREDYISREVTGNSSDLRNFSDAWEFQENDFMRAKERLRSIKANLAVLEGKMALAIIEAQQLVEVKQKRIDGAHKALQLLRTTCIVWPNSASEVLLVGSFDGWTTQRKMEKSKTGVFSVRLRLYPGRYEIKFVVDGVWKIDPLRPITKNHGHENNVFVVK
ncbi:hypothetical protein ABFS83_12G108100 [Erythranthe nasuta]